MTAAHPPIQHLAAGRSLQFWAAKGSTLHLQRGKVYLMPAPRWLADTMLQEPQLLLGGSAQRLNESGWVVLYAVSAVELQLCPAAPAKPWRLRARQGLAGLLLRLARQLVLLSRPLRRGWQ